MNTSIHSDVPPGEFTLSACLSSIVISRLQYYSIVNKTIPRIIISDRLCPQSIGYIETHLWVFYILQNDKVRY